MKENNFVRLFDHYHTGNTYYKKTDALRYDINDSSIKDHGTIIGYIVSNYTDDFYEDFMLISARNYKRDPSSQRRKQSLVQEAMKDGFFVIFVPELDIGFGLTEKKYNQEKVIDLLLKMRPMHYQTIDGVCIYSEDQVIGYTFAQRGYSAAEIMCYYLEAIENDVDPSYCSILSLRRPNWSDLECITNHNIPIILYCNDDLIFGPIDGSQDYWQLIDRILTNELTIKKHKITYRHIHSNKVDKYLVKEVIRKRRVNYE